MGTRADFYIGDGPDMEWLGSISWDGYPDGIPIDVMRSTSVAVYQANVERMFAERDDVRRPAEGWPWPWDDSQTTDYAYSLRDGAVYASHFGYAWFLATGEEPEDEGEGKVVTFPDMTARKNVRMDHSSGLIVFTA